MLLDQPREQVFKTTKSICPECREIVPAEIVFKNTKVYLEKTCAVHGFYSTLISSDQKYYEESLPFRNHRSKPSVHEKSGDNDCPFNCGLCENHKQESHIALIEITNQCNMNCPICIASSNTKKSFFIDLNQFSHMLDRYLMHNTSGEIHFQGGEPTLHPQFFQLLKIAKEKGVKLTRISTNGVVLASNQEFVKKLQEYNVVIHLQFDGFNDEIYEILRGRSLLKLKNQAIEYLRKYDIQTILSPTIMRNINESEIMKIINFGLTFEHIIGVTFHLAAYTGNNRRHPPANRITIPDVIENIVNNSGGLIKKDDIIQHIWQSSECFTSIHLIRDKDKIRTADKKFHIKSFYDIMNKNRIKTLYKLIKNKRYMDVIKDFNITNNIQNQNSFQIIVKPLMDAYNFDIERIKNCVVSVLTPDGHLIPYCAFNNLHRDMIPVENVGIIQK